MKKIRVALIGGGGSNSLFGPVHRCAINIDGTREIVAGALRSTPAKSMEAADELGIKGYPDYISMIEDIKSGKLEIDYVTIVTPNNEHYKQAMAFLKAGIPVLCEKPITITIEEAEELKKVSEDNDIPFLLAHTYTGHPMMAFAKFLIENGDIGEVRKIDSWYNQGWIAELAADGGDPQKLWRTNPEIGGISLCGGDIGTHSFVTATWTTGLKVKRLSARLNSFIVGNNADDDFNVIAEMDNGAIAQINATQIAIGYKCDNGFRIFGSEGSLEWHQEESEKLILKKNSSSETVYWLGNNSKDIPENIRSYIRFALGHYDDFIEALGNIHTSMERTIRIKRGEKVISPIAHPGLEYGVDQMKFLYAAVDSNRQNGAWIDIK
ncbi:MAG: Gfo/Idh/MocA family oxidoreductase [bacterium]|nr:Gfo/Idh/MocA family oxidoreductase [bacterium]